MDMSTFHKKGRADLSIGVDNRGMTEVYDTDSMRKRLKESLDNAGLSMRAASLNAELAKGYVHSVLEEGREPTVAKLAQLCTKNNISLAYVMFGLNLNPETERLIQLIEADPAVRAAVVSILERKQAS